MIMFKFVTEGISRKGFHWYKLILIQIHRRRYFPKGLPLELIKLPLFGETDWILRTPVNAEIKAPIAAALGVYSSP
jgi:hypothetical protein